MCVCYPWLNSLCDRLSILFLLSACSQYVITISGVCETVADSCQFTA